MNAQSGRNTLVISGVNMILALMLCPNHYLWVWFMGMAGLLCLIEVGKEISLLRQIVNHIAFKRIK